MSYYGSPSQDIVLLRDREHLTMMERGSNRLLSAIEAQRLGRTPNVRSDMMWLNQAHFGQKIRPAVPEPVAAYSLRDPCSFCGVRGDVHDQVGCHSYRRGAAA